MYLYHILKEKAGFPKNGKSDMPKFRYRAFRVVSEKGSRGANRGMLRAVYCPKEQDQQLT